MQYNIEIPILDQLLGHVVPLQSFALISFALQVSLTADVLGMLINALKTSPSSGHFDHDFWVRRNVRAIGSRCAEVMPSRRPGL
jgi:hypothetical protein